ncbi:hypothetical protein DRQ53_15740 [bacterium]|nr:MAG: hypothetical protein DRQ53_15740 [bacterium]
MQETPAPAAPDWMTRLAPLAAAITGIVLCFSAFTKFLNPKAFISVMGDYGLFASGIVLPLATAAVALELALGLMLLSGIGRRIASRLAVPLVVAFILLIIRAMTMGMSDCGCFGEVITLPLPAELGLDIVLLAMLAVVWRAGEDFPAAQGKVATSFGWVVLCLGALIFLARGPVVEAEQSLDLEFSDLSVLATADPPLALPREGFLFFFSADCDHCWAYAGGVELMARRLRDFRVVGVTQSDAAAMEGFREAFAPSYPIHVLPPREFNALVDHYPAGVWIQEGKIARSWAGFIPGLREIAEQGGYFYAPEAADYASPAQDDNPFGGTLRGRQ